MAGKLVIRKETLHRLSPEEASSAMGGALTGLCAPTVDPTQCAYPDTYHTTTITDCSVNPAC
jgi:hypothetical protein